MIHPPEDAALPREPELMSKIRKKLRHVTGQSEGYGTMTTYRSSQSDLTSEVKPLSTMLKHHVHSLAPLPCMGMHLVNFPYIVHILLDLSKNPVNHRKFTG